MYIHHLDSTHGMQATNCLFHDKPNKHTQNEYFFISICFQIKYTIHTYKHYLQIFFVQNMTNIHIPLSLNLVLHYYFHLFQYTQQRQYKKTKSIKVFFLSLCYCYTVFDTNLQEYIQPP